MKRVKDRFILIALIFNLYFTNILSNFQCLASPHLTNQPYLDGVGDAAVCLVAALTDGAGVEAVDLDGISFLISATNESSETYPDSGSSLRKLYLSIKRRLFLIN